MRRSVIKLTSIKIPPNGIHLFVKVKINKKSARLVLDTGASQTVLDLNRIAAFTSVKKFAKHEGHSSGIGSSSMVSHVFHASQIELGKCIIKDAELVLIDMVHVNKSYEMLKKKPVDGVLGGDILNSLNAVIDYKKKELILRHP